MKRSIFFILLLSLSMMHCIALADTTYVASGNVSGAWTPANSPYIIFNGDITVPSASALTINPGVSVLFTGRYKLIIQGTLIADGAGSDSIIFTRAYPTEESKWRGLRFDSANNASSLSYCRIEYAKGEGAYPDVRGGAIWINNCSPLVSHCLIANSYSHNTNYNGCGGGICLNENSSSIVAYNVIKLNQADSGGGILIGVGCDPDINDNIIENNTAFYAGGGIYVSANARSSIFNNILRNNSSGGWGGGAINLWSATWMAGALSNVYNNLICDNTASDAGGGIYSRYDASIINNNTIVNNTAARGGGIYVLTFSNLPPIISNSILWGNTAPSGASVFLDASSGSTVDVTYCDVQGGWAGTGNINIDPLFVDGPQGVYYLSQISAGQMAQSSCVDTGNPSSPMITGTTRTDCVQDAGTVDMGYHYELGAIPFNLVIGLTPFVVPTLIPAGGGSFNYELSVANNGNTPAVFDGWISVILPNGAVYGPVLSRNNVNIPAMTTIFRPNMSQFVPASAPAGTYSYIGYVGDYPNLVVSSDTLVFVKLAGDNFGSKLDGWSLSGWGELESESCLIAEESVLFSAYPNPFNSTAVLKYTLPHDSYVLLTVYDNLGREVRNLIAAPQTAGYYETSFSADNLSSGIYFVKLNADGVVTTQKLLMIK